MPDKERSDLEAFIRALPDSDTARIFFDRLESLHHDRAAELARNPLLLGRLLTIASYSPFLVEHLLRHPEYIDWLRRETARDLGLGKSTERLSQDLARFVTRTISADRRSALARFKHREFLRIYLRDCLGVATLAEVTEELSNLADAMLEHALALAHQEMVNLHGAPLALDARGRITQAELAIVALGKLGCRELNYASDIDLLFLYSGAGETAGRGRNRQAVTSNKEFFKGVAERVVQMIGSSSGEGAVYRIDLRLRPYGRDGDLVWEVERASDYYRKRAQNWERQSLIRARASAGSDRVMAQFLDLVRDSIFSPETLPETLADVRRAKEKIDRKAALARGGFDVKLGRGGIREIEFIAQALQLAHGGREPWLRSAQTLIVLARLAEKGYLSEAECARLSAAYTFLRTVEHRLQMEHGVQTHRLPVAPDRLDIVARRCGYSNAPEPAAALLGDLEDHTSSVRAIFNRVFSEDVNQSQPSAPIAVPMPEAEADDETARLINIAASAIGKTIAAYESVHPTDGSLEVDAIERLISSALPSAINPSRSLRNLIAWAGSLATYHPEYSHAALWILSESGGDAFLERLIAVLSSQYLSHILVSRPALASALIGREWGRSQCDFLQMMREAVSLKDNPSARADALRHVWYELVMDIGCRDMLDAGDIPDGGRAQEQMTRESLLLKERPCVESALAPLSPELRRLRASNLEQTALAEASLRVALEIALGSQCDETSGALSFAVMALGRLGHTGMDYGSDMDLLIIYDDELPWPPRFDGPEYLLSAGNWQEFYSKLTSTLVRLLSAVTREGPLYRVDLRLRPDGKSGPVAQGLEGLLAYLRDRASAWEHSAYLKVREVAGDLRLGARARRAICEAVFEGVGRNPSFKEDMASMRARLEREKARRARRDIKWGPGGMTDVYFVTRYIQLRDRVYFPPEHGTTALVSHLGETGSLDSESVQILIEGYSFLRRLDHWMRLLLDRPGPVIPDSQIAIRDITRALAFEEIEEFDREFERRTSAIRGVYNRVLTSAV